MPEIRITPKRPVYEEYADYPEIVQIYHQYDLYVSDCKDLSREEMQKLSARTVIQQLMVLSQMNEEEYKELQRSVEHHIPSTRYQLKYDWEFVRDTLQLKEFAA